MTPPCNGTAADHLVAKCGEVVGIDMATIGSAQGLCFAVSADTARVAGECVAREGRPAS